jgi:hypothetical protein
MWKIGQYATEGGFTADGRFNLDGRGATHTGSCAGSYTGGGADSRESSESENAAKSVQPR